jgi:hypothetical protein
MGPLATIKDIAPMDLPSAAVDNPLMVLFAVAPALSV